MPEIDVMLTYSIMSPHVANIGAVAALHNSAVVFARANLPVDIEAIVAFDELVDELGIRVHIQGEILHVQQATETYIKRIGTPSYVKAPKDVRNSLAERLGYIFGGDCTDILGQGPGYLVMPASVSLQ